MKLNTMKVTLKHHTPIISIVDAVRTCYNSFDRSDSEGDNIGEKDKKLLQQIILKGHTSTLEHVSYNFYIEGISRLCLQELVRHRIASPSVKSTRYTLSELKTEDPFVIENEESKIRAIKYLVLIDEPFVDNCSIMALENLRKCIKSGITNDKAKYCLPECYKTNLHFTLNVRSLRNLLSLRMDNAAHFEIRSLAIKINALIPSSHFFLFENL